MPRFIRRETVAADIRPYTPREFAAPMSGELVHAEPALRHVEQYEERLDVLGDDDHGPLGGQGLDALHRLIHAEDDPSI